jgi:hypothetical protein
MKNFIICLLLLVTTNINAQSYKYVEPGKQWYSYVSATFGPPYYIVTTMSYDSMLIDGKHYFSSITVSESGEYELPVYWRESDNKVYQKMSKTEPERIVYDWTLEKGDTIRYDLFTGQRTFVYVESIDTIKDQNLNERKQWNLRAECINDSFPYVQIIEGVGSLEKEFEYFFGPCLLDIPSTQVYCVQNSEIDFYKSDCKDFGHLKNLYYRKEWVTLRSDAQNQTDYRRYKFEKTTPPTNTAQLYETMNEQGNANWKPTGRFFVEEDHKVGEVIDNKAYLLFDYSLNAGDTFILAFPNEPVTKLIVESTDFIKLLDGRDYKRLKLICSSLPEVKLTWVEGVGDLNHFYQYRHLCYGQKDYGLSLQCYYYNANCYYRSNPANNCNLMSATEEIVNDTKSANIEIYPNPAFEQFTVVVSDEIQYTYKLTSIYGKIVSTGRLSKREEVNVIGISNGIYILSIYDDLGSVSKSAKISIQH